MNNAYAAAGLCRLLPAEELEELFWCGPPAAYKRPVKAVVALWGQAKAICARCPVLEECRASTVGEEFGVWGGVDQHERYQTRRRVSREILAGTFESRKELAAQAYRLLEGNSGLAKATVAREMGLTTPTVVTLAMQYSSYLEKEPRPAASGRLRPIPMTEQEIATVMALTADGLPPSAIAHRLGRHISTIRKYVAPERAVFPAGLPDGDGWLRYEGRFYRAHYVAQTADGKFVYLKFEVEHRSMIRWTSAADFELRRPITPVTKEWAGRTDRGSRKSQQEAA